MQDNRIEYQKATSKKALVLKLVLEKNSYQNMYIFYFDWFEDTRIFCAFLWKVVISFHLDIQIRYLLITICKKNFLNYLWIVHNYAADKSFLRLVKLAPSETVIQSYNERKLDGLVFLVSEASFEALYENSFTSVLFVFTLKERWVKQK